MQARTAGLRQQRPWPRNYGRQKVAGINFCTASMTQFFLRCFLFASSSHKHPKHHRHQQHHHVILSEHLHRHYAFALLIMASARSYQRRIRRKLRLLIPRIPRLLYIRNSPGSPEGSPENCEGKPLASASSTSVHSKDASKHPTIKVSAATHQGNPTPPLSRAPSPRLPTTTEQTLARVKLEIFLREQARRKQKPPLSHVQHQGKPSLLTTGVDLSGMVHTNLGDSMARFEVCTSMVPPTPDPSGITGTGSMQPTYITRTVRGIKATFGPIGEWRIVAQGEGVFYSAVDSLEAYIRELQMQVEEHAGMLPSCCCKSCTDSHR